MKKILFLAFFVITFFNLNAAENQLIKAANDFYIKGDYANAIKNYEQVLNSGNESAELYFNLGNAYYKSKKIDFSILNYERAKLLNPGDEDINFNLELARTYTIDKINTMPEFFLSVWIKSVSHIFSSNLWAYFSLTVFIFTLVAFLFYLFSSSIGIKKIFFWLGIILLAISLTGFIFSYQQKSLLTNRDMAIITNAAIPVKSSPDESGTDLFVLHEGTKVQVIDKAQNWLYIRLADGNKGWIEKTALVII
jgi:tetratricopeptide (TPR) repeat protein